MTVRRSSGTGLVLALLVLAAFALLVSGVWLLARQLSHESVFQHRLAQAQALAEAGLDDGLHALVVNPYWKAGFTSKSLGGGSYTVTVSTDNPPWLTSTGSSQPIPLIGSAKRKVTVRASYTLAPQPASGTLAGTAYTVNGLVNSYDSSVSTSPTSFGAEGNVWSNGTLSTRNGGTRISGNATYFRGSAPNGSTVTGSITKSTYTLSVSSFPGAQYSSYNDNLTGLSPQSDYNSGTKAVTVPSGNTANLYPGTYYFSSLDVEGTLNVNTSTGGVTVFLTGNLNLSTTPNTSKIINTSGVPGKFRIYGQGSAQTFYLPSNTALHALIEAPNATVNVNGSQAVYGQILAGTVTIANSAVLHYDIEFDSVVSHASWQAGSWTLGY